MQRSYWIIAGIHAYLGLHVVERGVIFVDLSLAQIASLGAAIAVWQGYDPHESSSIYWMSLEFTLIGAVIFAVVKGHEARIPQEAFIGISYAVASAAVILTLSKATGEAEHLRDMLVGNILSVQWPEVWLTALIYSPSACFTMCSGAASSKSRSTRRVRLPGECRSGSGISCFMRRSDSS
jgi:zinc/manganese transport system permease protein